MTSLRGATTLLNGNLGANTATQWAYVGAATDVTLFIDDGGVGRTWTVEVAVGQGEPGLNGIDNANPNAVPSAILGARDGTNYTIVTTGTPVSTTLSPFASQYIRIRPNGAVTAGKASISCVTRNSRSLRGHQTLWKNQNVVLNDVSAVGYVGDETNAVLFVFGGGAFTIQVAPDSGYPGMNEVPSAGAWTTYAGASFKGTTTTQAIDLSPFAGSFVRLKALGSVTGVNASLAVSD